MFSNYLLEMSVFSIRFSIEPVVHNIPSTFKTMLVSTHTIAWEVVGSNCSADTQTMC